MADLFIVTCALHSESTVMNLLVLVTVLKLLT